MPQIHVMLQHADQESGDDVDAGNDDAGDGVALGETRSAVHGAVKFSFAAQIFPAAPRLGFVNQAAVQVGVDGHLLAGHGVQREAGGNFGNAHRAVVDNHILDGDQHQKITAPMM